MRKILRIFFMVIGVLLIVGSAGIVIWGNTPAGPMSEALTALQSDALVMVRDDSWLVFSPAESSPGTGFIFYPGGRVDHRSYAPAARQIAAQGYLVVITPMPLSLAVLNADAAKDVMAAYPDIENWVIGGHSLGGAMAANFAREYPQAVKGLVLWAAYPASSDDLSRSGLKVVSIYASLDGLTSSEEIGASRALLPNDTTWVTITGGNHAQFGWYGTQAGDNPAKISREDQQFQIIQGTLAFLRGIQ